MQVSILYYWSISSDLHMIMPSNECHGKMIGQHWFRSWFATIRQQTITWANVEQYLCHMAPLGHKAWRKIYLYENHHYMVLLIFYFKYMYIYFIFILWLCIPNEAMGCTVFVCDRLMYIVGLSLPKLCNIQNAYGPQNIIYILFMYRKHADTCSVLWIH